MNKRNFLFAFFSLFVATVALSFLSFDSKNQQKKLKFEFTIEETDLIYVGLGKLPAEQVERLRNYILIEFAKQTDTTKKKSP